MTQRVDAQVAQQMKELEPNEDYNQFFNSLNHNVREGREVRQTLKRQDVLERRLAQMALDRVAPTAGAGVFFITDTQFMELTGMYAQAVKEGRQKECEFQPLPAYEHKLTTSKGKTIRPVFQGEVGMRGAQILCLEQGYGTGNFVQVPEKIGGGDE